LTSAINVARVSCNTIAAEFESVSFARSAITPDINGCRMMKKINGFKEKASMFEKVCLMGFAYLLFVHFYQHVL